MINDFGCVNLVNDDYITVAGHDVQMNLFVTGIIRHMTVRDFKKMLSVVKHQVSVHDYLHFLNLWNMALIGVPGIKECRLDRLRDAITKQMEKLPAWLFAEDSND